MGGALDPDTPVAILPENPCFDAMIESWADQASVRHLLDVLHRRELDRSVSAILARQPVLHAVTRRGVSYRVDPSRGIVSVTTNGSPVYPGIRDDELDTVVMPRVRRRAGGL